MVLLSKWNTRASCPRQYLRKVDIYRREYETDVVSKLSKYMTRTRIIFRIFFRLSKIIAVKRLRYNDYTKDWREKRATLHFPRKEYKSII